MANHPNSLICGGDIRFLVEPGTIECVHKWARRSNGLSAPISESTTPLLRMECVYNHSLYCWRIEYSPLKKI